MKLVRIDLSRRREEDREEERKETKESRRQREEKQAKECFFTFHSFTFEYRERPLRLQVQF